MSDGVKGTTTTAPTNANTHKQLSEDQAQEYAAFVSLMTQHYHLNKGQFLGPEAAEDEYGIQKEDYFSYLSQAPVIEALREAGVLKDHQSPQTIIVKVNDDWKDKALTPEQLKVANVMLDLVDTRSQKKKLQDLNVSTAKYQAWLNDPVFSSYLHQMANEMFSSMKHEAPLALLDKVRMGDTKAIQLYYELTGQYTPGGRQSDASQLQNFNNLLVSILEILNDEIDDPMVAARISERFKTLIGARNTAQALTESMGNEIVVPEVQEMRELSPRLQSLMEQ